MVINYDGPLCQCGQYGCLNCYATIPAVIEQFTKDVKRGHPTILTGDIDHVTIQEICTAAKQGDDPSVHALKDKAHMLATALANYINIVCPDTVILSGLLVKESDIYNQTAVATAKKRLSFTGNQHVGFERLGSYSNSLTVGAGAMFLEKLVRSGLSVESAQ